MYFVANLHDTRHAPAAARALISQVGQLALTKSGLPSLYSCVLPVVPELGGGGMQ
jgi:hypothetical protein